MELFKMFNISFIISVVLLTYIIIKIIDYLNKDKAVSKITKRIILIISIIIISYLYIIAGYEDKILLINSSIACPVVWSWLLKPICNKLGIDYKKIKDVLD